MVVHQHHHRFLHLGEQFQRVQPDGFGARRGHPAAGGVGRQADAGLNHHAVFAGVEGVAHRVEVADLDAVDDQHFMVADGLDGVDLAQGDEFACGHGSLRVWRTMPR